MNAAGMVTIDNPYLSGLSRGIAGNVVDEANGTINCKGTDADTSTSYRAINCKVPEVYHASPILQSIARAPPPVVAAYLQASLAENSKRAYRADVEAFLKWGGTIPATAEGIAEYLADQAGLLAPVTLGRRLVAIGKAHATAGFSDPTKSKIVRATLRGIRRTHGRPQLQAAPLLREDLLMIVDVLPDTLIGLRNRALIILGFAGGFRRSELVRLEVKHIQGVSEGLLITISRSKTDQEGLGRKIGIPYGRTHACPVKALRAWLDRSGIRSGPIFRSINKSGFISDKGLSGQVVSTVLKRCAEQAGLPSANLSGHSLRSGFVTSAARLGVSSWKIRQQTGHRSDAMLQRYIRDAEIFQGNAAGAVL